MIVQAKNAEFHGIMALILSLYFFLELFGNLSISASLKHSVSDHLQERLDKPFRLMRPRGNDSKYNLARTYGNLEIWARSWYL
jgi:hypothetical protein